MCYIACKCMVWVLVEGNSGQCICYIVGKCICCRFWLLATVGSVYATLHANVWCKCWLWATVDNVCKCKCFIVGKCMVWATAGKCMVWVLVVGKKTSRLALLLPGFDAPGSDQHNHHLHQDHCKPPSQLVCLSYTRKRQILSQTIQLKQEKGDGEII